MTALISLSIACTAFVVGFALGLMGFALFASLHAESPDHEAGAAEGDQISFGQSPRSPSAR